MTTDELRAKFEVWWQRLLQTPGSASYNSQMPAEGDYRGIALIAYQAAYAARDAEIEALKRDAEIGFLEYWLREAAEPVGQTCCGRGRGECCGSPDPVFLTPNEVFQSMSDRHAELVSSPAKESGE